MYEGDKMSLKETIAVEVVKATPAGTVGGLVLFGVPLSDVVLLASLALIGMQAFFLLRDKVWRDKKGTDGHKE